jgi:hypothetical protein
MNNLREIWRILFKCKKDSSERIFFFDPFLLYPYNGVEVFLSFF